MGLRANTEFGLRTKEGDRHLQMSLCSCHFLQLIVMPRIYLYSVQLTSTAVLTATIKLAPPSLPFTDHVPDNLYVSSHEKGTIIIPSLQMRKPR